MRKFDLAIVNAFRSFSSSSFRYSDGSWSREFTLATPNIIVTRAGPRSSYLLTWRDDAPPVSVSRSEATGID